MFKAIKSLLGFSDKTIDDKNTIPVPVKKLTESHITYEEPNLTERTTIHNCLEALGATADEVAETLTLCQIKGLRHSVCECPVALWIKQHATSRKGYRTHALATSNNYSIAYINLHDKNDFISSLRGPLPLPVQEFISRFDYSDRYPQLVLH